MLEVIITVAIGLIVVGAIILGLVIYLQNETIKVLNKAIVSQREYIRLLEDKQ